MTLINLPTVAVFLWQKLYLNPGYLTSQPLLLALHRLLNWRRCEISLKMKERQRTEEKVSQEGLLRTPCSERLQAAGLGVLFLCGG